MPVVHFGRPGTKWSRQRIDGHAGRQKRRFGTPPLPPRIRAPRPAPGRRQKRRFGTPPLPPRTTRQPAAEPTLGRPWLHDAVHAVRVHPPEPYRGVRLRMPRRPPPPRRPLAGWPGASRCIHGRRPETDAGAPPSHTGRPSSPRPPLPCRPAPPLAPAPACQPLPALAAFHDLGTVRNG